MSECYEVVIYTASISKYAIPLLERLDPLGLSSYHLFRTHCSVMANTFVKDLSLLGRDLAKTVIVDNTPSAYALQPDNAVPVDTWVGNPRDQRLIELIPVLEALSGVDDVREHIRRLAENYRRTNTYSLLPARAESTSQKAYKKSAMMHTTIDNESEAPPRTFPRQIVTKPIIVRPIKEVVSFPKVVVKPADLLTSSSRCSVRSTPLINLKASSNVGKVNSTSAKTIEPRAGSEIEKNTGVHKSTLILPKELDKFTKYAPRPNTGMFDVAMHSFRIKSSVKTKKIVKSSTRTYTAAGTPKDLIGQIRHVGAIINKMYSPSPVRIVTRNSTVDSAKPRYLLASSHC